MAIPTVSNQLMIQQAIEVLTSLIRIPLLSKEQDCLSTQPHPKWAA